MVPVVPIREWTTADAEAARARFEARKLRLARERQARDDRLAARALARLDELDARDDLAPADVAKKKAIVQAAIERARERRRLASRETQR
jgi:electron transport complex protein RnfB